MANVIHLEAWNLKLLSKQKQNLKADFKMCQNAGQKWH